MDGNFQVPNATLWSIICGVTAVVFGWLLKLERRPRGMTFKEHEEVCTKHREDLKDEFKEITRLLERQDDRSAEHRHRVNGELTAIKLTVATMAARQGIKMREPD